MVSVVRTEVSATTALVTLAPSEGGTGTVTVNVPMLWARMDAVIGAPVLTVSAVASSPAAAPATGACVVVVSDAADRADAVPLTGAFVVTVAEATDPVVAVPVIGAPVVTVNEPLDNPAAGSGVTAAGATVTVGAGRVEAMNDGGAHGPRLCGTRRTATAS